MADNLGTNTKNVPSNLPLARCPHCGIAKPLLGLVGTNTTRANNATMGWGFYMCSVCANVVTAKFTEGGSQLAFWPSLATAAESIPDRPRQLLQQAIESRHAPSGAIMLAASSVDSMLKAKGLATGSLNTRIRQASDQHVLTPDMADWAHDIRLDANAERHADDSGPLPNDADAERVTEFAIALGQFLFVLPAAVKHGRAIPGGVTTTTTT